MAPLNTRQKPNGHQTSSESGHYLKGTPASRSATYHFRWWLKHIVPVQWVAFIDSYTPGHEFSDQQVRGFFRYFHHTHTAVDDGTGSRYTDTLRFAGPFGARVDRAVLLGQMRTTFRARHARMNRMLSVLT